MGVNYYAAIVFGVPTDHRRVLKMVTKYDEDTGKPYQKQVCEHEQVFVLGPDEFVRVPDFSEYAHDWVRRKHFHGADSGTFGVMCSDSLDPKYNQHEVIDFVKLAESGNRFRELCDRVFPTVVAEKVKAAGKPMLVAYGY